MENLTVLQMKKEITSLATDLFTKASKHFNIYGEMPEIKFDIRGNNLAGQAQPKRNIIRYNIAIAENNYKEFLSKTVAHEVAHIIQNKINYGSQPHGIEWKRVMRFFGVPARRCHNYDVSKVPSYRKSQKFSHTCACKENNVHMVGKKVHQNILNGTIYICPRCHTPVKK